LNPKRVIEPAEAVLPQAVKKQRVWTFEKYKPIAPVVFPDGSEFRFPLQKVAGGGYDTKSVIDVSDEALATKLKQVIAGGDRTLREVTYGDEEKTP